jgi:hypothetical protein
MEANIDLKLTWPCCICCNSVKGRVNLRTVGLLKKGIESPPPHSLPTFVEKKTFLQSEYKKKVLINQTWR